MTDPHSSWLRRHRRAFLGSAAALLAGGGYGLYRAVERVHRAASRTADA
jgi:hypothetical protein